MGTGSSRDFARRATSGSGRWRRTFRLRFLGLWPAAQVHHCLARVCRVRRRSRSGMAGTCVSRSVLPSWRGGALDRRHLCMRLHCSEHDPVVVDCEPRCSRFRVAPCSFFHRRILGCASLAPAGSGHRFPICCRPVSSRVTCERPRQLVTQELSSASDFHRGAGSQQVEDFGNIVVRQMDTAARSGPTDGIGINRPVDADMIT